MVWFVWLSIIFGYMGIGFVVFILMLKYFPLDFPDLVPLWKWLLLWPLLILPVLSECIEIWSEDFVEWLKEKIQEEDD